MTLNVTSSKPHSTLLFWSLVVLSIAMILAIALALRGFNREMEQQDNVSKIFQTEREVISEKTFDINEIIKTGTVTSVIEKEDSLEKWVTLSIPSKLGEGNEEYFFYISSEIDGGEKVQSGSSVSFTPEAPPSKEKYISVRRIEFIK